MLGTLFKYDFKALGRTIGLVQVGVLIAGIFGTFLMGMSYRAASTSWNSSAYTSSFGNFENVASGVGSAIGSLIFAAVFASSTVTLFLVARYYYKNFFCDEGYLTFTLPVKPGQQLWAKLLAGTLWMLINTLVILLVCVIFSLFVFTEGFIDASVIKMYGELFKAIATPQGIMLTLEIMLLVIFMQVMNVLLLYAAISIGCNVAKTQKVLASVGFYLLFTFVLSIIISIISFAAMISIIDTLTNSYTYRFSNLENVPWFGLVQTFVIPLFICTIGSNFALYFMAKQPIKKNLNLS